MAHCRRVANRPLQQSVLCRKGHQLHCGPLDVDADSKRGLVHRANGQASLWRSSPIENQHYRYTFRTYLDLSNPPSTL